MPHFSSRLRSQNVWGQPCSKFYCDNLQTIGKKKKKKKWSKQIWWIQHANHWGGPLSFCLTARGKSISLTKIENASKENILVLFTLKSVFDLTLSSPISIPPTRILKIFTWVKNHCLYNILDNTYCA